MSEKDEAIERLKEGHDNTNALIDVKVELQRYEAGEPSKITDHDSYMTMRELEIMYGARRTAYRGMTRFDLDLMN